MSSMKKDEPDLNSKSKIPLGKIYFEKTILRNPESGFSILKFWSEFEIAWVVPYKGIYEQKSAKI